MRPETLTEIAMEYEDSRPNPIADAATEAAMLALMSCAPAEDAGLVAVSVVHWLVAEKYRAELPEARQ